MNRSEWLRAALCLAQAQSKIEDVSFSFVRTSLIQIFLLIEQSPIAIKQIYRRIPREDLLREAHNRSNRLLVGNFSWTLSNIDNSEQILFDLMAQCLGLDMAAFELWSQDGPSRRQKAFLCETTNMYLLPRPKCDINAHPSPTAPIHKHALLNMRILPSEAEGLSVFLHYPNNISNRPGPFTGGSAMFEDVNLGISYGMDSFSVDSISISYPEQTIVEHVRQGYEGKCSVIVWPELTIPLEYRDIIKNAIIDQNLRLDECVTRFVVAGSCYKTTNGHTYNSSAIYDGYGSALFEYNKILPYIDRRKEKREAITTGTELHVIATDDEVCTIAICLDYCELQLKSPFLCLDVDFIVVPSMGGEETLRSHLQAA